MGTFSDDNLINFVFGRHRFSLFSSPLLLHFLSNSEGSVSSRLSAPSHSPLYPSRLQLTSFFLIPPGPTDQPLDRPANHYCFQRKPNWTDSPRKVPRDRVVWNSFLRSIDHKRWQNGGRVVKARARPPSHKFDAQLEVRTFPWLRMPPLFASHVLFNMHTEVTCTCFLLQNNLHGQDSTFLCLSCPRLHAHCTCAHFTR